MHNLPVDNTICRAEVLIAMIRDRGLHMNFNLGGTTAFNYGCLCELYKNTMYSAAHPGIKSSVPDTTIIIAVADEPDGFIECF